MITYTLDISERTGQHHTLVITSDALPRRGDEIVIGPHAYYVETVIHNIHESPFNTTSSILVKAS